MELRQLTYLVAVAEEGNFTRAASRCGVAQPSLSQQIMNLEHELGEPLFVREPRRARLTEAGQTAYRHAREVLRGTSRLEEAFEQRETLGTGRLSVGAIPTISPYLLPEICQAFLEDYPQISIRMLEAKTSELLERTVAGELDLAIASDVDSRERRRHALVVREVFRESLVLAMPERHELAQGRQVLAPGRIPREELILLKEGHCLSDQVLEVCRGRREAVRIECEQLESLLALVAAGLGVAVVPEMSARRRAPAGVAYRRLGNPEPQRIISVVRRRSKPAPAAARFVDYIQSARLTGAAEQAGPRSTAAIKA